MTLTHVASSNIVHHFCCGKNIEPAKILAITSHDWLWNISHCWKLQRHCNQSSVHLAS